MMTLPCCWVDEEELEARNIRGRVTWHNECGMIDWRQRQWPSLSLTSFLCIACTAKCKERPKGKSVHGYHTFTFSSISHWKSVSSYFTIFFFEVFHTHKVPLSCSSYVRTCVHVTLQSCRVCIRIAIGSTWLRKVET